MILLAGALVGFLRRRSELVREASLRWGRDHCFRLGAALAFYALFSTFPLLLLLLTVLGFVLGNDASVRQRLVESVASGGSPAFRSFLDETLANMQNHQTARGIGAIVGFITILFGASGVFSELESTLNAIWRVESPTALGLWHVVRRTVRRKASSLVIVACTAVILLGSLVLSTLLSLVGTSSTGPFAHVLQWEVVETVFSVGFLTVLFASMYRMLPQVGVAWRDVFGGAFLTAVLFTIFKWVFAWYLSHLGNYDAYGATGAVLGLLMWIYIASLCFFFGAEYTRVYTERYGSLSPSAKTRPLRFRAKSHPGSAHASSHG